MKKLTLIIALFLVFAVAGPVSAQTSDLPPAGSTPGSTFYFLDRLFEDIGTLFTFGDSAKAERYLALAEERLAEAVVLAEEGDERAQEAVANFEEQVAQAQARASQTEDIELEAQITDATTKHLTALDDVLLRVPEEAQASIKAAQERSIQGQIESLRDIAERDPEAAVDIFSRAAEGRLNAAQARAERGGNDNEEVEDVEEALEEFNQYAQFGQEISTIAEGLQTGETTVDELVERATSRHLEILQDIRSRVPAGAQDSIQRAMDNSNGITDRPFQQGNLPQQDLPQQNGAPEDTGINGVPADIPSQTGQDENEGEGTIDEDGSIPVDIPTTPAE